MRLFRFVPDFPTLGVSGLDDASYLILAGAPARPARLAPRLQFVQAVGGSCGLQAGQRSLTLAPGAYALFSPATAVTVSPESNTGGQLFVVAAARGLGGAYFEDSRVDDAFVSPLLLSLRRALECGEMGRRKAQEGLAALLAAAARRDEVTRTQLGALRERETTRTDLYCRIQRAREFMDSRCGELPTAAHAAQIACMSVAHFHRCFAQIVGETPHRYLTRRRLERARERLRGSLMPIARLSQSLGFECPWTLTALFRRTYGLTPAQYRAGLEPVAA